MVWLYWAFKIARNIYVNRLINCQFIPGLSDYDFIIAQSWQKLSKLLNKIIFCLLPKKAKLKGLYKSFCVDRFASRCLNETMPKLHLWHNHKHSFKPAKQGKNIPVVLPSFLIKNWGESVKRFLCYDRKNKQLQKQILQFYLYRFWSSQTSFSSKT